MVHPGGDVPPSVSQGGQELPGTKPEDAVKSPPSASVHQAVITQEEAVPGPEKAVRGGIMDNFISRALGMKGKEFPKFVYMSSMMFCIIYIFTMTRCVMRRGPHGPPVQITPAAHALLNVIS